jgi:glycosyltransferase involved in cell wall biosynthesis
VHCLGDHKGRGWARRLRRLVRERRIRLVHSHSPYPGIGARLSLGARVRHVYTEHNVWPRYHRATYWANLLTYPRNDFVFAVSDEVRASIRYPRAFRFLRRPPVETLYHGLDPTSIPAEEDPGRFREELGIADGVPLVGTVGNFTAKKAHRRLIEAAAQIRAKVPEVKVVLVGHGPLEGSLREQVRASGLEETVVFAGYREDAPRVAAAFDVFVLSSEYEGLPLALLEAMARARPVVATRAGGIPEVVEDGTTALLVPPEDPPAIADAVVKLLADPALRLRLGEGARERAALFDIRNAVRRMEQIYERLLV